jgi:hypothetical protein
MRTVRLEVSHRITISIVANDTTAPHPVETTLAV